MDGTLIRLVDVDFPLRQYPLHAVELTITTQGGLLPDSLHPLLSRRQNSQKSGIRMDHTAVSVPGLAFPIVII